MRKILPFFSRAAFILILAVVISCSKADINNEQAIMTDVQGTWIGGYEITSAIYQHIKLRIVKDSFEGWVQTSDSHAEPEWAELPNENGLISLSSVLKDPENTVKFRKFAFTCAGRCCGDKSLSINTLSGMIRYVEGKGLNLGDKPNLMKKE